MLLYLVKSFLIFSFTYIGTYIVLPKLIHIASNYIVTQKAGGDKQFSLMDIPDSHRKVHDEPKPLVGGLGILIIVSLSSILFVPPEDLNLRGYYTAAILLGLTGFLDDFKELHYAWKFIAQIAASVLMIQYSRNALTSLGDILRFGAIDFGIFFAPLTVFCTLGVINAINMIDGMDGLAGGISLIACIAFSFLAYLNNQMHVMLLGIALSGSILAFLKFNWHPAKLFMGDSGSLFLGFSLAFFAIHITQKDDSIVPPVAALLILAVPIVDTLSVMCRRILQGINPFSADRNHMHHILVKFGFSKKYAVIIILLVNGILSITGVLGILLHVSDFNLFVIFLGYFFLHFALLYLFQEQLQKLIGKQLRYHSRSEG